MKSENERECKRGTKEDIAIAEAVAETVVRMLGGDVDAHRARRQQAKAQHNADVNHV